jgi:hypothetical protein
VTAAHPVIYFACVTNRSGAVKIVSASARRAAGQHKISWNKVGPAGPPGVIKGYAQVTSPAVVLSNTQSRTIFTLKLPSGYYLVNITARFNLTGSAPNDQVYCDLDRNSGHQRVLS